MATAGVGGFGGGAASPRGGVMGPFGGAAAGGAGPRGGYPSELFDIISGGKDALTREDFDAQRGPGAFDRVAERIGIKGDRITRADYMKFVNEQRPGSTATVSRPNPAGGSASKMEAAVPAMSNVKVFRLRHAPAPELGNLLQQVVRGTSARVLSYPPSNSLVVIFGSSEQLDLIEALATTLDQPGSVQPRK
jgi:hypothetical protein